MVVEIGAVVCVVINGRMFDDVSYVGIHIATEWWRKNTGLLYTVVVNSARE